MGNQDKIVKLETRGRKKGIPKVWKNIFARVEESKFAEYEAIARKIMNDETYSVNTFLRENLEKLFDRVQYEKYKQNTFEETETIQKINGNFYYKIEPSLYEKILLTFPLDNVEKELRNIIIHRINQYDLDFFIEKESRKLSEVLKKNNGEIPKDYDRNVALELLIKHYKEQKESLKETEKILKIMFEKSKG